MLSEMNSKRTMFSVLVSIYHKEQPSYLERALLSLHEQTLQADEIVIVEDGPITTELDTVITRWEKNLPIKRIPLEKNVGLGEALAIGLLECSYEIVARMDADDICRSDRFEKQIAFLEDNLDVDIVGTAITEFEGAEDNIYAKRELPLIHKTLVSYAQFRNPFNHMTVMYKKKSIVRVGSYKPCRCFEDYYLWVRLFLDGAVGANLKECLVNVRAGKDMLKRRHGWQYACDEARFWKKVKDTGYVSTMIYIRNILTRCPLRVLPYAVFKFIYSKLLRYPGA